MMNEEDKLIVPSELSPANNEALRGSATLPDTSQEAVYGECSDACCKSPTGLSALLTGQ